MSRLLSKPVSSAKATTKAHLYLATGLELVTSSQPDSQETIESFQVSIPELVQMMDTGEICDANSIAATFLALRELGCLDIKPYGDLQVPVSDPVTNMSHEHPCLRGE